MGVSERDSTPRRLKKGALPRHMKQSLQQWKASYIPIRSNYRKSITTCSFQTLVLSQLVPLRINWSGYLKWSQPSVLRPMWHVDHATRYGHGIAVEAILICNRSMSQS